MAAKNHWLVGYRSDSPLGRGVALEIIVTADTRDAARAVVREVWGIVAPILYIRAYSWDRG